MFNEQTYFLKGGGVLIRHEKDCFTLCENNKSTKFKLYENTIYVVEFNKHNKVIQEWKISESGTFHIVSNNCTINLSKVFNICCVASCVAIPTMGIITGTLVSVGILGSNWFVRRNMKKLYEKLLRTINNVET